MRVVVDTNVLVSGLLSPYGPPGEVVRMIAAGTLSICYDARIFSEYTQVLRRPKFPFSQEHLEAFLDQMKAVGVVVASDPLLTRLPDEGDEPFLGVALATEAECLITGNLKHFPIAARQGMRVLSPGDFLDFYRRAKRTKSHES